MEGGFATRFRRWTLRLDPTAALATGTPQAWASITLTVLLFVGAATKLPGAGAFFGLEAGPALLSFLPILGAAIAFWWRRRGQPLEAPVDQAGWILWVVGSSAVQYFTMSLIAFSRPPGSLVFGAILLYVMGFHGYSLRVTPREPFLAIGSVVGVVLAWILARDESRLVLAVVGPSSIVVELAAGSFARRQDTERTERDRLRAAVNAQLLEAQSARAATLEGALVDVLGRSHDVNNTVTGALLDAEALEEFARAGSVPPKEDFLTLASSVRGALKQIRDLAHAMRDEGRGAVARSPENVDVRPVCNDAVRNLHLLHPDTTVTLDLPAGGLPVSVNCGLASLRSVLDNLLLNACQGDGKRGASHVRLRAELDRSGALLRLVVEDDGPGFRAEQLACPITPFVTTKRNGTGLGLYTTERLVAASGGTVVRSNRSEGGACVELTLPCTLEDVIAA